MTEQTLDELNQISEAQRSTITDPANTAWLFAVGSPGYMTDSLSRNTARVYATSWKHFVHWCEPRGLSPLPASPQVIFEFIKECFGGSVRGAPFRKRSMGVALAAIKHAQRRAGFWVASCDDAIEYLNSIEDAPVNAAVATYVDLQRFLAGLPNSLDSVRQRLVLTLIYEELMRLPELIGLTIEDYHRGNEVHCSGLRYPSVLARGGKQWHRITDRSEAALDAWIGAAQIKTGQILCSVGPRSSPRRPLSVSGLDIAIRKAQSDWRGPRLGVRTLHRGHALEASLDIQRQVRREQDYRMRAAGMAFRLRDAPSAMERYSLARRESK